MKYIYLHGFASSPQSFKAQFFNRKLAEVGIDLLIPDLNLGDFTNLKISQQITYLKSLLSNDIEYCLIGSSLGGLLALILAERCEAIQQLIMLAPAIEIKSVWDRELGNEGVKKWQHSGVFNIFHSGVKSELPLSYGFVEDMQNVMDRGFRRNLPALVIHGRDDKTIPISVSYRYQQQNKLAKLIILECGHDMENMLEEVWVKMNQFIHNKEN